MTATQNFTWRSWWGEEETINFMEKNPPTWVKAVYKDIKENNDMVRLSTILTEKERRDYIGSGDLTVRHDIIAEQDNWLAIVAHKKIYFLGPERKLREKPVLCD